MCEQLAVSHDLTAAWAELEQAAASQLPAWLPNHYDGSLYFQNYDAFSVLSIEQKMTYRLVSHSICSVHWKVKMMSICLVELSAAEAANIHVLCMLQFLSSMRRRLDDPELFSSDVIFNMLLMYREIQVRWLAVVLLIVVVAVVVVIVRHLNFMAHRVQMMQETFYFWGSVVRHLFAVFLRVGRLLPKVV